MRDDLIRSKRNDCAFKRAGGVCSDTGYRQNDTSPYRI
jgi:hypothetical protein